MAVDSQILKVLVALLISLSLFHLSFFHSIEAAPIEDHTDEGAAEQLVPPSLPPISTKSNNLNPDETSTPPPSPLGPTQPPLITVTVDEESFLASTTESLPTITNEIKLPESSDADTDRETKLDHGLKTSASEGFMLYEVERDILGLSLDDINYILTFGPEVFAYSLADKLGYLQKFNGGDDPHISVIEANKEHLMEKLKNQMKQDNVQIITTKETILLEPITTTDPIWATVPQENSLDLSEKFSENENGFADPPTVITMPDVEPTSQEVMPEVTTESKGTEYHNEVITTAPNLGISTEDPYNNYDGNSTPNIIPEDNGAQDNSIHDNNNMHGVIAIEEKPSDDDESASRLFKQMLNDDKFLATLSDKKKELYLKLNQGELDREAASNLLDWYRVWVNDQMEDSHYGGPDGYYDNDGNVMANMGNGIGTKEGQEVKPEVEQGEGAGGEIVDNDREPVESESRESSNFGAVHFLVIFIITGAIMVTGYLCLHNKKKVRSSVPYSVA